MAAETGKILKISRIEMTGAAGAPLTGMGTTEDREERIMFKFCRLPGIETVAVLALFAETGLGMVRTLDREIFLFMTGKAFRLKQGKFTFNFGKMAGTTIQPGMGS